MSERHQQLIFAILRFLEEQLLDSSIDPDAKETLEVASQCLENVYKLNSSDASVKAKYALPASLPEIFTAGLAVKTEECKAKVVTPEQKAEADKFKSEGNTKMKTEQFDAAIEYYTKAIDIDSRNAVYFCNRAAAYSKMNKHLDALNDCVKALEIDPNYSKAYGRKGLAHSALGEHQDALQSFEKAVELDPANESYKKNLELAEQKVAEQANTGGGGIPGFPGGGFGPAGMPGMFGGGPGGMDFSSLLNNPALMSMATQMMSNPQMQEMMANMMGGLSGAAPPAPPAGEIAPGTGGDGGGVPGGAGMPDLSGLLQMGQQMAAQFQQTNPDLVDQLRQQTQAANNSSSPEQPSDSQDNKPEKKDDSAS